MAKSLFPFFSKSDDSQQPIKVMTEEMFAFLKQFPSALLLLDVTGKITFANAPAATLLNTSIDKLEGSAIHKWGLSMQQVNALTQAQNPPQPLILDRTELQAPVLQITGKVLADTPFIMLTLSAAAQFKQLTADKQFLTEILNHYPEAVLVQNEKKQCVWWNHLAEKLFGISMDQALGKHVDQLLPKELYPLLEPLDKQVLAGTSCANVAVTYPLSEKENCTLSVSKSVYRVSGSKETYLISVFENITSHYENDQQLQRSHTLLQAILNNVPLGLYTRDCDGKMTYFNSQSMKVLNEKDSSLTDHPHAFQNQDKIKFHRQREAEILKEGKPYESPEEVYVDSSGNEKILHLIKVPLMDAGPKPLVLSMVEDITKRHQQEQEVQRVNRFLSAIVQNAPIGLYARRADGHMLLRNKQCNAIFGDVSEEDYDERGKLPHETPEQASQYLGREYEVLLSGRILDIPEEEYKTASGERKLLHLVKVPIIGTREEERFVVTLVEDITERRQQERDLLETKNSLQSILEHVPVAIYARSVDDKISFINKRALEMFPGETEYKNEDNFYGHREKSIFEEGKMLEFPEEWYTTKNGEKILLHLIKAPVFDKEGKPFMVLTVAEDITHKKEQERAIVDAKNFLQAVINQLPVSLSVKNYDGKYILWNKKSEELFGVRAEDVIGRTAYRTDLNKDQAEFLREADLRVFENKKEQTIPQELISSAEGGIKIMHTVKTPVFNPDGTPNCLLVVSEDITAKTKMEKQIREANDKNTLLIENAREGVIIVEDGKIIYANHAFCQTFGFQKLENIKNKPLVDLAVEEHKEILKEKYEAVVADLPQADKPVVLRMRTVSKKTIEVEFSAIVSRYLGRRIVLGFVRDITEENRNLRAIKTERDHFRAAFENSVNPVLILSHKGYILVMNESCRKLFGFTEKDQTFYRNVYMRPALTLAVRRKLKSGQPAQMEYTFDFERAERLFPGRIHGTGCVKFDVTFVPINKRDAKDGSVSADYVVFLVSKGSNLSSPSGNDPVLPLPSLEHQPASIVEKLVLPNSEPYVLCDSNFSIETCNELFCSLCQLQQDELVGQDLIRLFPADTHLALMQDLQTLRKEGSLSNREYALLVGSSLEVCQVRISAVKDSNGRYLFVLRSLAFQQQIMKILEERSAHLTALLSATGGIVFSVQFDHGRFGKIEPDNAALAAKLGYTPEELTTRSLRDLFFDPSREDQDPGLVLTEAEKQVKAEGKSSFRLSMRPKDAIDFDAQVTVVSLELPGKETALVVVNDLTAQLNEVARESQQALELQSVRKTLPGLYIKMNADGMVLDVHSNLDYLSVEEAQSLFLNKTPEVFWPKETAQQVIFSLKESLAMQVDAKLNISWEIAGNERYFDGTMTPIKGRDEVVLWLTDSSNEQTYSEHLQEIYRLIREPARDLTDQVEAFLALGKKIFQADIGMVLRFRQGKTTRESVVMYAPQNEFNLQRHMEFNVEECLDSVADGSPVLWPDLGNMSCHHCIHTEKHFGALLAAPLKVHGQVMGALCFAAKDRRRSFDTGAEEMLGVMARLLSLRLELHKNGRMLEYNSKALLKVLSYSQTPAVALDPDFQITYVNEPLLQKTGQRTSNLLGRNFFEELTRDSALSKQIFKTAAQEESAGEFSVKLDLLNTDGLYKEVRWTVFACQGGTGNLESYILLVD